jgi:hydrogenase maturation protein HypF
MLGPTALPRPAPERVLACGSYLKNSACLIEREQVRWSELHGDLNDADACAALQSSVETLLLSAGGPVLAIAHDLHPDFHSTHVAFALAHQLGVPAIAVQHHHAHIAAVIAEQGLQDPVIGLALDGVGLGSDGLAWGGEVLQVDGGDSAHRWRRLGHLQPLPLPGGDLAAREPWRVAAGLLHTLGRSDRIEKRFAPLVGQQAARVVHTMLQRNLNCPLTTSAGRWFDAAASALGLSVRQSVEAEAAIALEGCARDWLRAHPSFDEPWDSLDLRPLVARLFEIDPSNARAVAHGAASFHMGLINGLAHTTITAAREHGLRDVVLSGGCFMNQVLTTHLTRRLQEAALTVHTPRSISCGDAGVALGQAWIAACTLADPHFSAHAEPDWEPTHVIEMELER